MTIDPEEMSDLHTRLLAGDKTVSATLFSRLVKPLAAMAQRHGVPWDEAGDLATDTLTEYLLAPGRYDPRRGALFTWLSGVIRYKTCDAIRARMRARRNRTALVEEFAPAENHPDDTPEREVDARRIAEEHLDDIVRDEGDRRMVELFLMDIDETSAFAEALGVAHLPPEAQRHEVQRRWNRLEKRLQRLGERLR